MISYVETGMIVVLSDERLFVFDSALNKAEMLKEKVRFTLISGPGLLSKPVVRSTVQPWTGGHKQEEGRLHFQLEF